MLSIKLSCRPSRKRFLPIISINLHRSIPQNIWQLPWEELSNRCYGGTTQPWVKFLLGPRSPALTFSRSTLNYNICICGERLFRSAPDPPCLQPLQQAKYTPPLSWCAEATTHTCFAIPLLRKNPKIMSRLRTSTSTAPSSARIVF